MNFSDEPNYEKMISLMKEVEVHDDYGIKTGTRIIDDDELNEFQWNQYFTGYYEKITKTVTMGNGDEVEIDEMIAKGFINQKIVEFRNNEPRYKYDSDIVNSDPYKDQLVYLPMS